jgi:hypothetical protein
MEGNIEIYHTTSGLGQLAVMILPLVLVLVASNSSGGDVCLLQELASQLVERGPPRRREAGSWQIFDLIFDCWEFGDWMK